MELVMGRRRGASARDRRLPPWNLHPLEGTPDHHMESEQYFPASSSQPLEVLRELARWAEQSAEAEDRNTFAEEDAFMEAEAAEAFRVFNRVAERIRTTIKEAEGRKDADA